MSQYTLWPSDLLVSFLSYIDKIRDNVLGCAVYLMFCYFTFFRFRFVLSNRKKIEVDINAVDKDGWSALLYSVSARNHEFCKMLILEGRVTSVRAAQGYPY